MKIAIVYDAIHPYVVGGVEKRNWEIATRLAKRGHDVTLFGMKFWEGDDIIYKDNVRLWGVCPARELNVNGKRSVKQAIYVAYKIPFALLKETYDVIDVANFPFFPCFSAKLASLVKKSNLIITCHGVWNSYWYEYLGKWGICGDVIERMAARLTPNLIAVSELTKRDLSKIAGKREPIVIPNGVDLSDIEQIEPFRDESDILFVGRLTTQKNVDIIIKSLRLVKEQFPEVKCHIIGEGPEFSNISDLVKTLDLQSNVEFKGTLQNREVLSRMKASKVLALPSRWESFGIVALEAAACGLPVVTVNHPQNAVCDLVVDGETGYIVEHSEEKISEKLLMAMEQTDQMSGKCTDAAQPFDWNEVALKTENYYCRKI